MWEIVINGVSYTKHFQQIQWSGDIKGSARRLECQYTDTFPVLVKTGDKVYLKHNFKTLFIGKVFTVTRYATKGVFKFVAYDNAIYLNKNRFVKNIYNMQPSQIVKQICAEIGIEVGELPQDKIKCSYPAINRTGYEIILQAYTIQHKKDKVVYSVVCKGENIVIANQGHLLGVKLNSMEDIQDAEYRQSIEDMVNQIVVYKTDGEKLQIMDKVANEEDKKKYGIFQDVMEFDKEQNNLYNAREMLKGLEQKANITVIGNTDLISGYSVSIEENSTKLIGNFLIEMDKHVVENGNYHTILELSFENKMDKVEFDEFKRKKKKESAFEQAWNEASK